MPRATFCRLLRSLNPCIYHCQAEGEVSGAGAAAAAAVLTAVDEDEEGGEEAEFPRSFDYFSDGEEES